jgi:hypothetical protein
VFLSNSRLRGKNMTKTTKEKPLTAKQAKVALKYMGACDYGISQIPSSGTAKKAWEEAIYPAYMKWIVESVYRNSQRYFDWERKYYTSSGDPCEWIRKNTNWSTIERFMRNRYQAAMKAKKKANAAGKKFNGRTATYNNNISTGPF